MPPCRDVPRPPGRRFAVCCLLGLLGLAASSSAWAADSAQAGVVTGKTAVTATIRVQGDPVPWAPVTFTLDGLGTLEIHQTQTGSLGRAVTVFVPPIGQSGTATITASAVVDGDTITDTLSLDYEGRGYYTIADLGNPQNVAFYSIIANSSVEDGLGLNNQGEVVFRSYILRAGQAPEPLPTSGAYTFVTGYNITDAGEVLGFAASSVAWTSAIFRNGQVEPLPHHHPGSYSLYPIGARAMNAHGTVVGGSTIAGYDEVGGEPYLVVQPHATAWNGGAPAALVEWHFKMSHPYQSLAHDINDAGLIVGEWHYQWEGSDLVVDNLARVWYPGGSVLKLPHLGINPRYSSVVGRAINNHNAIAGWNRTASDAEAPRPVLWLLNPAHGLGAGVHVLIDAVGHAFDINDAGQVVGNTVLAGHIPGRPAYGFLWQNGEFQNLNDLIDPDSLYYILEGIRINENGQIACWANLKANPNSFAVLLLSPQGQD